MKILLPEEYIPKDLTPKLEAVWVDVIVIENDTSSNPFLLPDGMRGVEFVVYNHFRVPIKAEAMGRLMERAREFAQRGNLDCQRKIAVYGRNKPQGAEKANA